MAGKRQKKEPDVTGRIPGNVDLRGLTREEVLGKDSILKRLTGRLLQKAPEAEMTERLGCGYFDFCLKGAFRSRAGQKPYYPLSQEGEASPCAPNLRFSATPSTGDTPVTPPPVGDLLRRFPASAPEYAHIYKEETLKKPAKIRTGPAGFHE